MAASDTGMNLPIRACELVCRTDGGGGEWFSLTRFPGVLAVLRLQRRKTSMTASKYASKLACKQPERLNDRHTRMRDDLAPIPT